MSAFELWWFEETRGNDGPERFGVDGPLGDLLPLVTEVLGYENLLRGEGIRVEICGWALALMPSGVVL